MGQVCQSGSPEEKRRKAHAAAMFGSKKLNTGNVDRR
jgi:hypothetical protein